MSTYQNFLENKGELKWQQYWADKKLFAAVDPPSPRFGPLRQSVSEASVASKSVKPKFYCLIEFPYPSAEGLHVGHPRSYTALDVLARKRRMQNYNVLYPIGFDAFGLPSENYAIKTGIQPSITTEKNIDNFSRQLKSLGFSFDWDREVVTTDPSYYQWTQWIFLKMWENGLAYKQKIPINWCLSCKVGLANEEVVGGVCERCGGGVEKREKDQWLFRITKYADRLIEDLDNVDYLEKIKVQQINWIGRSEGTIIKFQIPASASLQRGEQNLKSQTNSKSKIINSKLEIEVFTTRPDTLFGVTFMVVSPEHELIKNQESRIKNQAEVEKYVQKAKSKSDLERTDANKEKTGVELRGIVAINPANNKEIPIFVADYVLANYGTGAIMAVPAHDQRDFEFAKKYNIPIVQVVAPFFTAQSGQEAPRPEKETAKRLTVGCFVKHWQEDKYLCLDWDHFGWHSGIIGGIEDNEDAMAAGLREIQEETGYKNIKFIRQITGEVHSHFYAAHKDVNRYAYGPVLLFQLENDEWQKPEAEHIKNHEAVWIDEKKMAEFLNLPSFVYAWQILQVGLECFTGDGAAINSGFINDLKTAQAKNKIIQWLESEKIGRREVNYKLRDWIFSRQRYWGEPIPMVYCENCKANGSSKDGSPRFARLDSKSERAGEAGWVPLPESELPLKLPVVEKYEPTDTGESPLAAMTDWVNTTCPVCGGPAKRETDTMPNWAGSNWYFLRYIDPHNDKALADKRKLEYWAPVDWYNGGLEHTTLHLLYSRFIYKFLWDIGAVPKVCGSEPYKKRTSHGMILGGGGEKMSKSRGNVVNPDDVVNQYGADTLRIYEMFMGPFDQAIPWDTKGVVGVRRFLDKVWSIYTGGVKIVDAADDDLLGLTHRTIKKVGDDIETQDYNTAVSALMILANKITAQGRFDNFVAANFLKILSVFAPHIAEELWQSLGHKKSITLENWPEYDAGLAAEKHFDLIVQINGKLRDKIKVAADIDEPTAENVARQREKVKSLLADKIVKNVIFVPGRLINFVI